MRNEANDCYPIVRGQVGELSQPVFSDSGVHLIYRYA